MGHLEKESKEEGADLMFAISASMSLCHGKPSCCEGGSKKPMEEAALIIQVSVNRD